MTCLASSIQRMSVTDRWTDSALRRAAKISDMANATRKIKTTFSEKGFSEAVQRQGDFATGCECIQPTTGRLGSVAVYGSCNPISLISYVSAVMLMLFSVGKSALTSCCGQGTVCSSFRSVSLLEIIACYITSADLLHARCCDMQVYVYECLICQLHLC